MGGPYDKGMESYYLGMPKEYRSQRMAKTDTSLRGPDRAWAPWPGGPDVDGFLAGFRA